MPGLCSTLQCRAGDAGVRKTEVWHVTHLPNAAEGEDFEEIVDHIVASLSEDLHMVRSEELRTHVEDVYRSFSSARVRTFVPLLARRAVHDRYRHKAEAH